MKPPKSRRVTRSTRADYVSDTFYPLEDTHPRRLAIYAGFSRPTLQQLELTKLNETSLARRNAREQAELCIQLLAEALAARWFLDAQDAAESESDE